MPQFQFDAIGTHWNICFQGGTLETKKLVKRRIEEFDRNYSRFRNDSLVAQWADKAGVYMLPEDGASLFEFYKKLYDAADGLVTPLIGGTLEQAGYDAHYSLKPKKLTPPPTWEEALEFFPGPVPGKKHSKLIVKQPVLLDFGATGKGYLVDIISHLLHLNDIDQFCVNASGDLFTRNHPQTIGLEDPDDATRILGTVEINNEALCSSAGNRRRWDKFHHIINPRTLVSPRKVKAAWVKAETTMLADGIATALFFVSPETLLKTFDFEYAMIENEDLKHSRNFNAQFFTK